MKGFRDEGELWNYQKPRLHGKWDRYELITPAGHPDVKGSHDKRVRYIENKIGWPSLEALEPSQVTYIKWLLWCDQEVWLCFGAAGEKAVSFHRLVDPMLRLLPAPSTPDFWSRAVIRR